MCPALRELFKEEIEAEIQKAVREAERKAEQEGRKAGYMRAIIEVVKYGVIAPEMGAERLHISVDEMKRLAALE